VTVPFSGQATKRLFNNCEDDICRCFNSAVFERFRPEKRAGFFPRRQSSPDTAEAPDFILRNNVNNGVVTGPAFAMRQRAYEIASRRVFFQKDSRRTRRTVFFRKADIYFGQSYCRSGTWRLFLILHARAVDARFLSTPFSNATLRPHCAIIQPAGLLDGPVISKPAHRPNTST